MERKTTKRRYERKEAEETTFNPDWPGMMEAILTHEGSMGDTYRRLYQYSMANCAFLLYQGVPPQPVATYARWQELGRWPRKGSKAKAIIRPINIKLKDREDDDGNPLIIKRFKPVRSVFPYEDTEGDELEPAKVQDWDLDTALKNLDITQVPFESFEVNTQGYSWDRNISVNPVAKYPLKTIKHELAHVCLGHTMPASHDEYTQHRGLKEFEAESSAHLIMNELGARALFNASESRAYIQTWLQGQKPPDQSIRAVFRTADEIIKAGRTGEETSHE